MILRPSGQPFPGGSTRRSTLALLLAGLGGGWTTEADAADRQKAKVARIETSLVPRLVIRGRPEAPRTMADRMAFYRVPGVSLAFFSSTDILWTRQHGVRDHASDRPVTPDTVFQASSISKTATALATLRLVREGKLDLDGDVSERLVGWTLPPTDLTATEKVTVRRLLSHNAGVTVHGFAGYAPGEALPTLRQILNGAPPANNPPIKVDRAPGSGFRYSGGGYVVLQQLLADVTGDPFAETVRRTVLKPAGMARSSFAQTLSPGLKADAAGGHTADGLPMPGGGSVFPESAPAGLWATPSDLARLAMELARSADGRSDRILDKALAREMLTPQAGDWGLGVDLTATGDEVSFSHVGTNPGFQAYLIFIPGRDQGLAVMTNGANQSGFFLEIVMAVAREYGWPGFRQVIRDVVAVEPGILDSYAGTWRADGAPDFQVQANAGRLFVQGGPFGPEPVELFAETSTRFFILSTGFTFDFSKTGEGRAVLGGGIATVRVVPARPD